MKKNLINIRYNLCLDNPRRLAKFTDNNIYLPRCFIWLLHLAYLFSLFMLFHTILTILDKQ